MQPDLIIADGVMPGRSGYDLCASVQADPSLPSTAVYILASAQQPYDEARGRQCGADGHFLKPWDTDGDHREGARLALAKGPTEVAQPQPTEPSLADDFGPPMPSDVRSGSRKG